MRVHTQLPRLRVAAQGMALGWAGLALNAITVVVSLAFWDVMRHLLLPILITGAVMMVISLVIAFTAGAPIRCDDCGGRILSERFGETYLEADRAPLLHASATALVRVLRREPMTCMHCGAEYATGTAVDAAIHDRVREARRERRRFNGKPADVLVREHRIAIRAGTAMYFVGLGGCLLLYRWAGFANTDWRPAGLGVGFALAAIPAAVALTALARRQSPREAVAAYIIDENLTPRILWSVTVVGLLIFVACVVSLW